MDMIYDFDFVIGAKGLIELEADACFKRLRYKFIKRAMYFLSLKDIGIQPGKYALMKSRMRNSPPDFKDG